MDNLERRKSTLEETLELIKECREKRAKKLEIDCIGQLDMFPEGIRELTWLTHLTVSHADIKVIPDWIGEMINLSFLDIRGNNELHALPESIINLKKLRTLILDSTGIEIIPAVIGKMYSLEIIGLDIYELKEVPQCVLDLPKLRLIKTRGYYYDEIPTLGKKQRELYFKESLRCIEKCKKNKSKTIDLSFLKMEKLPEELSNLYWLENLDLSCNYIKELPDWICNFQELTRLDICCNKINVLPENIGNLKKLKIIDISGNKIRVGS